MDIREVSDQIFVSPQITETDLAVLQEKGFKSIICNRPDGEGMDQPTFQELSQTALKMGIAMRYIPVSSGLVDDKDAADFGDALNTLPKPILAYCRSGARSATLWSLAQADDMPLAGILSATKIMPDMR